jgi:hypothetical protein
VDVMHLTATAALEAPDTQDASPQQADAADVSRPGGTQAGASGSSMRLRKVAAAAAADQGAGEGDDAGRSDQQQQQLQQQSQSGPRLPPACFR